MVLAVCERYSLLPNDKKQMIAGELDRSVREIERKIAVCSVANPLFARLANRSRRRCGRESRIRGPTRYMYQTKASFLFLSL